MNPGDNVIELGAASSSSTPELDDELGDALDAMSTRPSELARGTLADFECVCGQIGRHVHPCTRCERDVA